MAATLAYDGLVAGTDIIPADEAPPSSVWRDPLEGTPYRTLGQLGRGGGGEVVLAEHRTLGTTHAAKLALLEGLHDPNVRRRLELEGQALARLRHPNLVHVTNLDVTPVGRLFLVMEYLTGETLHQRLERTPGGGGPLELEELLLMAEEICHGLTALHERGGLVHRDLKPSNIFLAREGDKVVVKLLDLGLAKIVVELASTAAPTPPPTLTATGVILGTPRYMSPEQISGEKDRVGPASDLYALGAIMYRGLTGRGPFDYAKGWDAVLAAHVLDAPTPPSSHLSAPLPEGLDAIVLRCLEKKPEDRFESAAALAHVLAEMRASIARSGMFAPGYVTQPVLPATIMMEPELRADPSHLIVVPRPPGATPVEPPRGVSWNTFVWLLAGAIVLGAMLGGLIVAGGIF